MTGDLDALRAAAAADPGDRTAKLVYADRLDEAGRHGAARALRFLCAVHAACAHGDPVPPHSRTSLTNLYEAALLFSRPDRATPLTALTPFEGALYCLIQGAPPWAPEDGPPDREALAAAALGDRSDRAVVWVPTYVTGFVAARLFERAGTPAGRLETSGSRGSFYDHWYATAGAGTWRVIHDAAGSPVYPYPFLDPHLYRSALGDAARTRPARLWWRLTRAALMAQIGHLVKRPNQWGSFPRGLAGKGLCAYVDERFQTYAPAVYQTARCRPDAFMVGIGYGGAALRADLTRAVRAAGATGWGYAHAVLLVDPAGDEVTRAELDRAPEVHP